MTIDGSTIPHQNGVTERKNRTVTEMAHTMLKEKNMPTEFWAEAVTTMVYIVNQSSTSMVENLTPYEALTRSRPNVEHFKVFGCLTFSLVDPQLRAKFDAKSRKGIFIGYNDCSKAYKVVDPITKKINIDWDIQFFEKRS